MPNFSKGINILQIPTKKSEFSTTWPLKKKKIFLTLLKSYKQVNIQFQPAVSTI